MREIPVQDILAFTDSIFYRASGSQVIADPKTTTWYISDNLSALNFLDVGTIQELKAKRGN